MDKRSGQLGKTYVEMQTLFNWSALKKQQFSMKVLGGRMIAHKCSKVYHLCLKGM